ncbi:MAG: N-formylglutamate amidohydrolase [Rhizobiaceae bacterium]|nr:N-formylglutamate amidohydrolase [Rhizobiaceae bacterium]
MDASAEFAPFETIGGDASLGLVLVADHAKRALPAEYGDLGLPASEFDRHIAYDIGVEEVTRRLAALTDAPAVLGGFSRLLIDPNRGEDDPTLIRQIYDGTIIPGNYPLQAQERERRLERFYRPYHGAVSALIADVAQAAGCAPFVFSIHSFTPRMQNRPRPWQVSVLWDSDPRAPKPLFDLLAQDSALTVGNNEPYDGALRGDTMFRHCIVPGIAHALIEIRQDLIADAAGAGEWAERLAPMLDELNRRPDIHEYRQYGSRTGPVPHN